VPSQEDGLCGESLLNRRCLTHKNAPFRGVFFCYWRFTGALATSLVLHVGVLLFCCNELADRTPSGYVHATRPRQAIPATLTLPENLNSQLSTSSAPIEAGSNDIDSGPESTTATPTDPSRRSSPAVETETPRAAPVRYFERQEVDRPPRIIDNLDARDGPLEIALAKFDVDGSIVIECMISDRGLVDNVIVVNTTLPESVVRIVLEQAKLASFIPARLNHVAVPSRILIELSIREKPKPSPT
jgi:hypothetical protein